MKFTAKQIASFIDGEIIGNENAEVYTFAKIEEGVPGALSFLGNPKYTEYIYTTESTIVLVNKDFVPTKEIKPTLIKVDNAYNSLAKLLTIYEASKPKKQGISSLASIATSAKIGENCYIAPYVVIGENCEIGDNCMLYDGVSVGDGVKIGSNNTIYSHAVIYHDCRIGNNCILHGGCVIGADGFGFAPTANGYEKIPQTGIVIVEDNVEIGANTCIDRATMGATVIHSGVKLDNLIQIAHNDEVGSHTAMAAQVGVAGSTKIGEWCIFGGQAGISGHSTIGNHTTIGPQCGTIGNLKGGETVLGSPAIDAKEYIRAAAYLKRLPEMSKKIKELTREIEELKKNK
ncbi:MAG: UDP-3-O-(3-hydroxymyristoyl)glucosamine N-acyltransferase [Bacteroidaceae bacterium]|nr:UDP-3-O-(3-hydroxymyristoyl)glucosamine N-acyltransferase [Bacteroidaceae bacterium]MBQ6693966.1 UDP-3-O-(3-hydroxymyristoyl)glucosamine N-acyltransferase [Bacteroidaceae bacterium]